MTWSRLLRPRPGSSPSARRSSCKRPAQRNLIPAIRKGDLTAVKLYLAGVEATDAETGASAAQVACEVRSLASLVELLKVNAPLNSPDAKGRTALHRCLE
eukprot:RCo001998